LESTREGRASAIKRLLREDARATDEARRILAALDPWLATALDEVAEIYAVLHDARGSSDLPRRLENSLGAVARELQVDRGALMALIRSGDPNPKLRNIRELYRLYRAVDISSLPFVLCGRYFRWMATDLLRGRVTAAIGYLRLQSEAVALVHLFHEEPEEAEVWLSVDTAADGRAFYRRTQKRLKQVIEELHLLGAYDWGSSHSLHVRMPPVLRAHTIERTGLDTTYLWLKDHEFDAREPRQFLDDAIRILHTQAIVLNGLQRASPWADTKVVVARLRDFASSFTHAQQLLAELDGSPSHMHTEAPVSRVEQPMPHTTRMTNG